MKAEGVLIELIANVICDKPTSFVELSDKTLKEVYTFAKHHDLSHFIGAALVKKGIKVSKTAFQYYQNDMFVTVVRMQKISYEYDRVCEALEKAKIQFIPLKGAVIKNYYPEFWMRTSCDIDILVRQEQVKDIVKLLTEKYGYACAIQTQHDYCR